nr:TonB-dependent receptor [Haliea salexigens]|tara:strand:- start:7 stop:2124 length:2118 start_codon:yes stop_codon:yes gene_type:complete
MTPPPQFSRNVLHLPVLIAAAMAGTPLLAAEQIEEVIVTSSRVDKPLSTIPNTVTVIDQATLQQQLSIQNDISTVLGNLVPSFSPARQKMTNAGETLRGRKPLYLIDGVPQSNPLRNGGRDGHTIDPTLLERVEVLHGANAIHGLGAAGGIINLITKRPSETFEQHVRVDSAFQGEDIGESGDYGLSYSLSNSFDAADILAGVSYRSTGMAYDADGEVIGVDNTQGDTMDSEALDLFLKTGYDWDDQRVELMVNHYDIESNHEWISVPGDVAADIPSGAVKGELPAEGAQNQVTTISLNYLNADWLGQEVRVQAFRQDFEATYGAQITPIATFQDPSYGPDLVDQSQNNSEKTGLKLTLFMDEVGGLPLSVVYGMDVLQDETWQALIQTGRTWVPETRYENLAPYLQLEYTGIERMTLTAGVRHEKSELQVDDFTTLYSYGSQFVTGGNPDFSETLYNAGGTYQFTDTWRVFANYAEAFSMPDVGRVLRGINEPGQDVESFLDLTPILTENAEIGLEFDNGTISAQLSYYTSNSDFGQRLQRGDDGIYTVKREKTDVDGLEFRADWALGEADVLGLRYAQAEGRFDSDQDGRVDSDLGGTNISPDRLNLSWERRWTDGLNTRLQLSHLFDRKVKDSEDVTVNTFDGYTTLDLIANLDLFGGVVSASIQNLTNEDYYTYYSQSSPNDLRNFKGVGRSFGVSYQRYF